MPGMAHHPVFYDPSQRRSKQLSVASIALAIFSTLLVLAFIGSVLVLTEADDNTLAWNSGGKAVALAPEIAKKSELLPAVRRLSNAARRQSKGVPRSTHPLTMPVAPAKATRHKGIAAPQSAAKPLTVGFYVNWDESSYVSLKKALPDLDWVVPEWMWLRGPDLLLSTDPDLKAVDLVRRTAPQTTILPMLQNAWEGNWNGEGLAKLLADPARRRARLNDIITFIEANAFQGLTVDFERVPKRSQAALRDFLREMHDALKARGLILAVAVPFDDTEWDYRATAKLADYLILMAYDEHYEEGAAGPIASQGWFVSGITKRMKELDPSHTIVAIGNYGYDWQKKGETVDLTFQEAVLAAMDTKATITFDPQSLNPSFAFNDGGGRLHRLWFLDAVTAYNQIHAADTFRPAGYALWRLGAEDPSIWPVLAHVYGAPPPSALNTINPGNDIDFVGDGEILQIASEPKNGARSFALDKTRQIITSQTYTDIPTSYVMRRTGSVPGKVALTFDDGPSPDWTPSILDILKEKGVKATFFIIGENGESNPGLLKRIVAEGHEIGNHTFTHPNLAETPQRVTQIELNATQRLVEALTGRSIRLFRPPYFGDAEPTTSDEIAAVKEAGDLGYITVGLRIDPDDWQQPAAGEIVSRVMEQIADTNPETRGQIILLHDAGGDRSQTVKALPTLIDQLRAKGLQIVPVSDLAGWTLDQVDAAGPAGRPVTRRQPGGLHRGERPDDRAALAASSLRSRSASAGS